MFLSGYLDRLCRLFERTFIFHPGFEGLPFEVSYENSLATAEAPEKAKDAARTQVLRDWPRGIEKRYRLAGVPIQYLNAERPIQSFEDLQRLFEREFAIGVEEEDRAAFVSESLLHCHQGGLIHNTGRLLSKHYQGERVALSTDPNHKEDVSTLQFLSDVTFYPIKEGLGILERNRLTQIVTMKRGCEDTEEAFEFNQTSPVEILTYSTMTYDSKYKCLVISTPKVQTLIKEERMYDLLGIKKTTQPLVDKIREKMSEEAIHLKQFASKVRGGLAKTMVTWMGSKERLQASIIAESEQNALLEKYQGQVEGHVLLLKETLEKGFALTQNMQSLLSDKHHAYLSLIDNIKLSRSYYKSIRDIASEEILCTQDSEEAGKFLIHEWVGRLDEEGKWAREHIKENTEREEILRQQLCFLQSEYATFTEAEQKALSQKFFERRRRLENNISLCDTNIERLNHFLCRLPKSDSLEENVLFKGIAAMKENELEAVLDQLITFCQHYDMNALSLFNTIRQLAAWQFNNTSLLNELDKTSESLKRRIYTNLEAMDVLMDTTKAQLEQFALAERILKEGTLLIEGNLNELEKIAIKVTDLQKEQASFGVAINAKSSMTTDDVKATLSSFFRVPKRPGLLMTFTLHFWHSQQVTEPSSPTLEKPRMSASF